ncbi:MAG: CHRD domain-containing protein [Chloroflexi bacterium]|nr:MAG: CHRD domain-containing protein [Chloroflexota bacterium]TME58360.1 MAG: CHRD domain-containing protein [Chloroflexota bacterium]
MALVTLAAIASACGSSPATATTSPSPSPAAASPSPSPSPLSFKLNGIKTVASGTITLIAAPHSVSIELKITGLQPNSSHVSHIHIGSCQQVGNISLALNQVVADGNGEADTRSTLTATYPPASGTWYVVVHAGPDMQGSNASYLLCGNLFA